MTKDTWFLYYLYFRHMKKSSVYLLVCSVFLICCNRAITVTDKSNADMQKSSTEEIAEKTIVDMQTVDVSGEIHEDHSIVSDMNTPQHNYAEFCASCHGAEMDAFVDRKWQYGQGESDLFKAIKFGYEDDGMPGYEEAMTDQEINELVIYIKEGILNVDQYNFDEKKNLAGKFKSEEFTIKLDTIASGLERPWGLTFLKNGNILIGDRNGKLYERTKKEIYFRLKACRK